MPCLAPLILITAAMLYDGDSIRKTPQTPNGVRLEGLRFEYDTAERGHRAECPAEARKAEQALALVQSLMPGCLMVVSRGDGAYGRDVGVLLTADGRDVAEALLSAGLARVGRTADWCEGS